MSGGPFTHDRYRAILRAGLASGYRFAAFHDIEALRRGGARGCLLRHDCDNDLVAAARMAEIEAEEGVSSTYFVMVRSAMYNLLAPPQTALVRRILSLGHWLGLHFDESVVAELPDAGVPAEVDRERVLLRTEFGCPVDVVSFHQPGARILEGRIALACVNTYDRGHMAGFHYTSDSNLAFRGGDPIDLFAAVTHPRLQVLVHPEWWTTTEMSLAEKWNAMLLDNVETMQGSLLAREDTYNDRRVVSVAIASPAREPR
jgi:hypothetical protein